MGQQEIEALTNAFRRQGLTWDQTNFAVAVVRNRVEAAQKSAPAWHDTPTCGWKPDDCESGTWVSACGELWQFDGGGPKENNVRFCHGCGKPVVVKE